jgi:hypothetical protein
VSVCWKKLSNPLLSTPILFDRDLLGGFRVLFSVFSLKVAPSLLYRRIIIVLLLSNVSELLDRGLCSTFACFFKLLFSSHLGDLECFPLRIVFCCVSSSLVTNGGSFVELNNCMISSSDTGVPRLWSVLYSELGTSGYFLDDGVLLLRARRFSFPFSLSPLCFREDERCLVPLALLSLLAFLLSLRDEASSAVSSDFGVEDCFLLFDRTLAVGELNDNDGDEIDVRESSHDTDDGLFRARECGLASSRSGVSDDREPDLLWTVLRFWLSGVLDPSLLFILAI